MSSRSTVYEHVWQSLLMSESPGSLDPWCNVCVHVCVFVLLAVLLPPAQGVCAFPFCICARYIFIFCSPHGNKELCDITMVSTFIKVFLVCV